MTQEPEVRANGVLEKLSRGWRRDGVDVRAAMEEFLEACRRIKPRGPWGALAKEDWGADRAAVVRWLSDLLGAYPPPTRVQGLWFGVPAIEYSEPNLWVIGAARYAPDDPDWASGMIWPGERVLQARKKLSPINVELAALVAVQRTLRLEPSREPSDKAMEAAAFFAYVLPLAYVTALLGDVLPLIWPRLLMGKAKRRGVECGYQGGDGVSMGWLGPSGWE